MKKSIIFFVGIISSLIILIFLYYNFSSNDVKEEYLKNSGFKRKLLHINLSLKNEYDLKKGYYSCAGIAGNNKIIIRNVESGNLIVFNPDHTRSDVEIPGFINRDNIYNASINPFDTNLIDFHCNNDLKIFVYDLSKQKLKSEYTFNEYFDKAARASNNAFYSFMQGEKMNQLVLTLIEFDVSGKSSVVKKSDVVKDAMKEDGMLKRWSNGLIYVNFYNNSISMIDFGLKTKRQYKTLDTITSLPQTVNIKNNTITKFLKQPRTVNQITQVSKNLVFINSHIRAENDMENDPDNNSDILDVYDLSMGYKYLGTLYFHKYKDDHIQDFLVQDDNLILVYPTKTLIYEFSL